MNLNNKTTENTGSSASPIAIHGAKFLATHETKFPVNSVSPVVNSEAGGWIEDKSFIN
jgi:hypothetical protein